MSLISPTPPNLAQLNHESLLSKVESLQDFWRAVCHEQLRSLEADRLLVAERDALPFQLRFNLSDRAAHASRRWKRIREAWHDLVIRALHDAKMPVLDTVLDALRIVGWPIDDYSSSDQLACFASEWTFACGIDLVEQTREALGRLTPAAVEEVHHRAAHRSLVAVLSHGRPTSIRPMGDVVRIERHIHTHDWRLSQHAADMLASFIDALNYLAERAYAARLGLRCTPALRAVVAHGITALRSAEEAIAGRHSQTTRRMSAEDRDRLCQLVARLRGSDWPAADAYSQVNAIASLLWPQVADTEAPR